MDVTRVIVDDDITITQYYCDECCAVRYFDGYGNR